MNGRKILQYALGPIGAGLLVLVTLPSLAWLYSAEDIGRLNIAQNLISLGILLFSLSMHESYVREYHEVENKGSLLSAAVIPGSLVIILLALGARAFDVHVFSNFFSATSAIIEILILLAIALSFCMNMLVHVLRMQERGLAFSVLQVLPKLSFLLLIGIIYIFGAGPSFDWLLGAHVASLTFACALAIFLTRTDIMSALNNKVDVALMSRMLKFGMPLVVGGVSYWGLTASDRILLKSLSDLTQVGIYAMAASIAASMSVIAAVFSSVWHPVVYRWAREGADIAKVRRVVEYMTLLVGLMWSLFGLAAPLVTYFLPENYVQVQFLIVACVAMPLFYVLSEATVVGIGISRKSYLGMAASLIALASNLLVNWALIPSLGAKGAAAGCLVSFFVFFIVRTELSSLAWKPMVRMPIYAITTLYVFISGATLMLELSPAAAIPLWLLGASATLFLLRPRVSEIFAAGSIRISNLRANLKRVLG